MRFTFQFLLDAVAWSAALLMAVVLRSEFHVDTASLAAVLVAAVAVSAVQLVVGLALRLYQGRYRYGSFEEVRAVTLTSFLVVAVLLVGATVLDGDLRLPRSAVLIALPIALLLLLAVRYVARLARESAARTSTGVEPAIVFGAGYLGETLVRRMATDPASPYVPVGLLDDDPGKRHVRIRSVDVLGRLDDLPDVVSRTGATVLVVAIAGAGADLIERVVDLASPCGLQVKVLPPLSEVLRGATQVDDLRDLSMEDLLGRPPVNTDVERIAGYLTGKRVLVTGAGGSIGSELCRQINRYGPAELIMLDRDETGLQSAELGVLGHGLLTGPEVVLADIRDAATLLGVFRSRRPEVVFHAAALKHLPMLQQYPEEAWKTNVLGTQSVLDAARAVGVSTFVNISTDKAANPCSVLGHSKRLAERLTAEVARQTGSAYLSVRFGNVLGSRGSVLPLFTAMIEHGGPVTVTDPDVTRYFMTIPEACQLVIQAGAIGHPGEVLILDMGEPVRILDIAERMIQLSGRDVEIVFTGLREGEKLHEDLVSEGEQHRSRVHPKISRAAVPALSPTGLDWTDWSRVWLEDPLSAAALTSPVGAGNR
ncbi:polysaccharide biosynthesis protein [Propionicicella superfundia]|uniref:polysaccharide biosynthesis protein n=1 Tax=Propionicicella superfundia TaxID=348582 RepID=UPI001B7F9888|nr:nucleoside-diphosphate sugar epimerase/dehydratase [Propionicicella superfundia]